MVVAEGRRETRRFTADEVMRMIEAGVLQEDEHVELLDGELVVVNPQGPVHSGLAVILHAALERAYGRGHHVRDHSPVRGTSDSIPEPDVAVVRGDARAFLARLPGPEEVPLVAEVAYSSLGIDRRKASVYARSGYTTYWIVDVEARRIEVRTGPQADGLYVKTEIVAEGAELHPPGASVALRVIELLP